MAPQKVCNNVPNARFSPAFLISQKSKIFDSFPPGEAFRKVFHMNKKKVLYIVWAVLYCLCVGLGFVNAPTPGEKVFLALLSIGFFVPPYWLYFLAKKENSRKTILVLRLISLGILALTVLFLILTFLSVNFSQQAGLVMGVLLTMFSAPMICSQIWVLPLFLWACLLMLTLQKHPCQR